MREVIIEMTWTCDREKCGHTNRGRDETCARCGHERSLEAKEYLDADAEAVTDAVLVEEAKAGEHWVCIVCSPEVRNETSREMCQRCGSPRDLGAGVTRAEEIILTKDFDRSRAVAERIDEPTKQSAKVEEKKDAFWDELSDTAVVASPPSLDWNRIGWVGAGVFAFVGVVAFLWYLFASHPVHARVSGSSWSRTAILYRKTAMNRSGWGTPTGAFNASCITRQRGTHDCDPYDCSYPQDFSCPYDCNPHPERYNCGREQTGTRSESYECRCRDCNCRRTNCTSNKNGFATCQETCSRCCDTCTKQVSTYGTKYCTRTAYDRCPKTCTRTVQKTCYRQCPTMDRWCDYQVWEWPEVDRKTMEGKESETPAWPLLEAAGMEERVEKSERYRVTFTDGKKSYERDVGAAEYKQFAKDSAWVIEVSRAGIVSKIVQEDSP